jgi:hypothetical protein
MGSDPERPQAPPGAPLAGSRPARGRQRRLRNIVILGLVLAAAGIGVRVLSKRYGGEVSVPGIYVKVRPERGGMVEARALPAPARHPASPPISMEVTLADVASLARLIEEVSRLRIALPCPVPQRVSLHARDAPVENVLEAVAAAANLHLTFRDGTFVLDACPPVARAGG